MQRNMIWKGLDADTVENCAVNYLTDSIMVRSEISGWFNRQAVKVDYVIRLDNKWQALDFEVIAQVGNKPTQTHIMHRHVDGKWYAQDGQEKNQFMGCNYIDITLTPFTNSLPVNGIELPDGKSRDIDVLYIDIMDNKLRRDRQRYTKLDRNTYRFENDDGKFIANLDIDEGGFVKYYPGLFELLYNGYKTKDY